MTDDDEKEDRKKTNTQYMQIQYQKNSTKPSYLCKWLITNFCILEYEDSIDWPSFFKP